ncbi:transcriptional regulator GcvA [Marinomonas fungiae]|uniref:DNA-binding transcriptional regulator, LysR family n=1 Tax=Marinomonas fungiae TaxID=1137284 RepID=A0A0K6ISF9_9GAMM|nr:transcriptional regulator GcvA [Marinomonas fungiae]CUB06033.1 DNA-binding transcriptional regulator, LysR family [Marinomonas fungiae]
MKQPLPPLNPLKAFESAARLLSLTAAAEDLNVSQVAVSRQVKVLEDYLGVALFKRLHRGIELTDEGKELFDGIESAFQDIADAARKVSRRGRRDILSIQSYTTFSQRWLIPRLADFHKRFEATEVRISSSLKPVDFETQNIDAAIRSGFGDWPELHAEKLVDIELIPVCSPEFLENHQISKPEDLQGVTLLHSLARNHDWEGWFNSKKIAFNNHKGIRFDYSSSAYEAASMGMGVALAVKVFVEGMIEKGQLVSPFPESYKPGESYYLVWSNKASPSDALLKFLKWIRETMER